MRCCFAPMSIGGFSIPSIPIGESELVCLHWSPSISQEYEITRRRLVAQGLNMQRIGDRLRALAAADCYIDHDLFFWRSYRLKGLSFVQKLRALLRHIVQPHLTFADTADAVYGIARSDAAALANEMGAPRDARYFWYGANTRRLFLMRCACSTAQIVFCDSCGLDPHGVQMFNALIAIERKNGKSFIVNQFRHVDETVCACADRCIVVQQCSAVQ